MRTIIRAYLVLMYCYAKVLIANVITWPMAYVAVIDFADSGQNQTDTVLRENYLIQIASMLNNGYLYLSEGQSKPKGCCGGF